MSVSARVAEEMGVKLGNEVSTCVLLRPGKVNSQFIVSARM